MADLLQLEQIATTIEAFATIALVFLLWRTVRQMEHTVSMHRIQTEYRFRPWIGPQSGIKLLNLLPDGRQQFDVPIKNYGELPSLDLVAYFKIKETILARDEIKSNATHTYNLGPMLPNMEKHYWFFIETDLIERAMAGKEQIFIALYLEYKFENSTSGYGMVSQFDTNSKGFVHRDMWVDTDTIGKKNRKTKN